MCCPSSCEKRRPLCRADGASRPASSRRADDERV
jgi:hypothetical protein